MKIGTIKRPEFGHQMNITRPQSLFWDKRANLLDFTRPDKLVKKDFSFGRSFLVGRCFFCRPFEFALFGYRFVASLGINLHIAAIEQQYLVALSSFIQWCELCSTIRVSNPVRRRDVPRHEPIELPPSA
jgi:hypothetical protein